jgi:hypothetical protein
MKFTKEKTQEPTIKRKYEKPVLIVLSNTDATAGKFFYRVEAGNATTTSGPS